MTFSETFVRRPIGTVLLTVGVAIAGAAAFFLLPVASMPNIDYPVVLVQANLPGGSPETMSTSVATPLERHLGHIADVDQMTSSSRTGQTTVVLQFGIDRDINGAARDVEAAINAARIDLPVTLRTNPTYRKANPAAAPIVVLALTSATRTTAQIYDAASNIIEQKLSQLRGVGEVQLGGGALPGVRVELNPNALSHYGIGPEDVRAAISSANANRPKGIVSDSKSRLQIYTNDSATKAADYRPLVIAYRDGAAVRLSDVADVEDGPEDVHNLGLFAGPGAPPSPAIVVQVTGQPGANVIATVDEIKAVLPAISAALPADINMDLAVDRTVTIRASLGEVEKTLLFATLLVVAVVAVFLRSPSATLVPAVAVVVSLLGTLGVMYLAGFSLDNLSLMALTVATGFVVDDAIVVLENITRHLEAGMGRLEAALTGVGEVAFTVFSISVSLIAVFLPILLMGGVVGRMFREFAVTLSTAIIVSLLISLTTTPMMCAYLVSRAAVGAKRNFLSRWAESAFDGMARVYQRSLIWALDSGPVMIVILLLTVALNVYLYVVAPKGFFPQQSNGQLIGAMQLDQSSSFQLTRRRLAQYVDIISKDPGVERVVGFTGGRNAGGQVVVTLKSLEARDHQSDDMIIARLRPKLFTVSGSSLFLQAVQDVQIGGRQGNAQFQYTLKSDDLATLKTWAGKLADELKRSTILTDVNSDQEDHGLESFVTVDRNTAARLGVTAVNVDNTLYDAFGQRQVSVIYSALNQYHVVMEAAPAYNQEPDMLSKLFVSTNSPATASTSAASATTAAATTAPAASATPATSASAATTTAAAGAATSGASASTGLTILGAPSTATTGLGGTISGAVQTFLPGPAAPPTRGASQGVAVSTVPEGMVPLSAIARFSPSAAPTAVNHQDTSVATTISFNLAPGYSLSDVVGVINEAQAAIGMPTTVQGGFQGTAKVFQQSLSNEPILIAVAILAIYIVLGVLYESYVHPLTVLSTLPSAGVGASLALILFKTDFSLIALIGVILLIGIVKKNAIMIIDFAIDAERSLGLSTRDAIYRASMLRFRPIMMTTFAAILGALPLVLSNGAGAELRKPLGITIIGGLLVSQILTLLTTPVVYLYLDRWTRRGVDRRHLGRLAASGPPPEPAV
jgi:multidrug efflux pump